MKLYYATTDNGKAGVCFEDEELVCNIPRIFDYLISCYEKDVKRKFPKITICEFNEENKKSENELIDAIIEQNGIQAQTIQLGEEMAELFTAVSHRLRNRTTSNEHIKEEIADVMFMLRQLIRFFDLDEQEIEEVIEYKKHRMRERLKKK